MQMNTRFLSGQGENLMHLEQRLVPRGGLRSDSHAMKLGAALE